MDPFAAQDPDTVVRRLVGGCYLAIRDGTPEHIPQGLSQETLDRSGLGPLYGALCGRFGLRATPEVLAAGMLLKATNRQRWTSLQATLVSLRATGIEPVVFKGGALVARWSALLDLRLMDDFDLLVPQRQLKALQNQLAAEGFQKGSSRSPVSHWLSKGALVWRGHGVKHQNLDLHSRVTEPPTCRSLTRSILATRESEQGVRIPDVEDCVCMIALHIVRSGMSRPLKEYIDVLWYTEGIDESRWQRIVARATQHRLDAALFIALRQAIYCSGLLDLDPARGTALKVRLDALGACLPRWRRSMIDRLAPAHLPLDPDPRNKRPLFRRSVVMYVGIRSPIHVITAFIAYGFGRLADHGLMLFAGESRTS